VDFLPSFFVFGLQRRKNLDMKESHWFIAGCIVFLLFAALLWATHTVLSPILVGIIILFMLFDLKQYPLVRRLGFGVVLILLVWFFVKAHSVIFPFLVAFVLAYLFDPLANQLEKWGVSRTLGVLLLLLVTLGLMILVGMILIPSLVVEIQYLIGRIPDMATQAVNFVQKNIPRLLVFFHRDPEKFEQSLLEEIPSRIERVLLNFLKGISGIGTFLSQIFNVVIIPILTFYFLKDLDRIRTWALDFVPRKYRSNCYFYLWRTNRILGGYIRGQIIVCSIVGLLTGFALAVFKIPFAILLGVITGVLNIIPYIGLYISLGLALLASFFAPNVLAAMVKIGAIFLVVQTVEVYVISPKIIGDRVGLHPVAVIFSILVFSRFLGFWGLIIGVPTAALIKFLMDEWKRRKRWREILAEKTIAPRE